MHVFTFNFNHIGVLNNLSLTFASVLKQLAYIYFLAYFLIGSMTDVDMHELVKISNLVEHFKEHLKGTPNSTVLELLDLHYGSDSKATDHQKRDQDKHTKNLPFQSHSCCHAVTFYVVSFFDGIDFKFYPIDRFVASLYNEKTPPILARTIWQPPKLSV